MPADRSSASAMGRVVFLVIALAGVIAIIVWMQRRAKGPSEASPESSGVGSAERSWETELIASVASAPPQAPAAGGKVTRTVRDRKRRDEIRDLIYQAYGMTPPKPGARTGPHGTSPLAPLGADAGRLEPEYIQDRIREDFVPLAKQCYEAALEREPGIAGRLVLSFVIVGDEDVGGIVESAELDPASTITEKELVECMRESMLSLSFVAPEGGGSVTVTYPFGLSPGDGG